MPINPDLGALPLSKIPNFDARTAPAVGTDAHLPAVPAEALTPAALRSRFICPPVWEPELRKEPALSDRDPTAAAVLVPIVMRERLTVLLTERTTHLSNHSGQVAFPGGKSDKTDRDAIHTALREAHEEIGLEEEFTEVIGTLPVYTTTSQFMVTPVVALVRPDHELVINAYEVADTFEVPLDFLMNPAHHWRHEMQLESIRREWLSMPYMDGNTQRFIWGATAGMLRNFYRFLSA